MSQPRVAVVGGGVAGTFCSLVLRSRGVRPVLFDAASAAASASSAAVEAGGGSSLDSSSSSSSSSPLSSADDEGERRRPHSTLLRVGSPHQFLRSSDPRLSSLLSTFEREGFVSRWDGRFGMLGSRGGGFLPADVVAGSGVGTMNRGGESGGESGLPVEDRGHGGGGTDCGDYCHFVSTYGSDVKTYVGTPNADELCPSIRRRANIDSFFGEDEFRVVGAEMLPEGGWGLRAMSDGGEGVDDLGGEKFDGLILAGNDTALASATVRSIASAEAEAVAAMAAAAAGGDAAGPSIADRLHGLADDLRLVSDAGRMPVYTLSALYPPGLFAAEGTPPFDAAAVPGSHLVQFLSRDASKPGRGGRRWSDDDDDAAAAASGGGSNPRSAADAYGDGELWTAVSTSAFASSILAEKNDASSEERTSRAAAVLAEEVSRLLAPYAEPSGPMLSEPTAIRARLGRSAFPFRTLGLKEECVTLAPWRLAICGDFVRGWSRGGNSGGGGDEGGPERAGPFEMAAISGLEAGERAAAFFG